MSAEENKAIVRRFYEEIWNKGDMAAADELIATDIIDHDQDPETRVRGPESVKQLVSSVRTIFPDFHFVVEDEIAEGNKVAVRWTMRGTHKAEFMGIPATGKQVTGKGMHFWRVAGGKIVETWVNRDDLGMMQQLGVVPPMGDSGE
jgi:steroid delta-isomerase-like uncharacterized protein